MNRLTAIGVLLAVLFSALACTKEVEKVVVVTPTGLPATATAQPLAVATSAPPTPLPDRTNCEEIRGTEYRSPTERQWYLDNCVPTPAPAGAAEPPPPPSSACHGLPTYSEVVAAYPADANECMTNVQVYGSCTEACWADGLVDMRTAVIEGHKLVTSDELRCYGAKLEVTSGKTATLDGVVYPSGAKLTVDKDLSYVQVCSWD